MRDFSTKYAGKMGWYLPSHIRLGHAPSLFALNDRMNSLCFGHSSITPHASEGNDVPTNTAVVFPNCFQQSSKFLREIVPLRLSMTITTIDSSRRSTISPIIITSALGFGRDNRRGSCWQSHAVTYSSNSTGTALVPNTCSNNPPLLNRCIANYCRCVI